MSSVEERVSLLEAKLDEHSRGLQDLRKSVVDLEVRVDRRFEGVDRRFDSIDRRFTALEDKIDRRFDSIERGQGRLIAIQLASMTAMVAALAGIVTALLRA